MLSCLRNILGVTVLDRLHSDIIRQKCETSSMAGIIKECRLRWLGHVGRMGNKRLPERMSFARTKEGQRNRGRPRKSWAEMILFRFENTGGTGAARIELTGGI